LPQFFLRQQANAFEHRDVRHGTQHIVLCQIKVHFTVTAYREAFDILIYLNGFFPKFLSHVVSND